LVLSSWQYLKSQSALCQAVYAERQNSNLSLYCTTQYPAESAIVAPFLCKLCCYSHYLCALLPTVHCSTICIISTIPSCWTLSLGCNCTAICAMLSCSKLYSHTSCVLPTFYHSSPRNSFFRRCGKPKSFKFSLITSNVFGCPTLNCKGKSDVMAKLRS